MKKIIFTFATLLCTLSMNAQIVKLYNGNTLVKTYSKSEVTRVKFMNEGDAELVSGITLSSTELSLNVGETSTLTATVAPSDANNQTLTWASSNESVATVADGVVTAVGEGSADITASASDGSGIVATCSVTVATGLNANGHTYVDMGVKDAAGMPVYFATMNLGATSAEEGGDYIAWGETTGKNDGKTDFSWSNYKYNDNTQASSPWLTKYQSADVYENADCKTVLDLTDDAASVNWGGDWRMPTYAEFNQLVTNCTWERTTLNGKTGYRFTASNGNSIFLPIATGYYNGNNSMTGTVSGFYWTSTVYSGENEYADSYAYYLRLLGEQAGDATQEAAFYYDYYKQGMSIRPVMCKTNRVESITLSKTSLTVGVTCTATLTATISPSDATIKDVTWTTSDASVATVVDGVVTGIAAGTATITCVANDGSGVKTSCEVIVVLHEYVDLGLSVKWATCNVGASSPEEYGNYFAWGEITGYDEGKTNFTWSNYTLCNGSSTTMTKYCTSSSYGTVDNKTVLESTDDAAAANWGGAWRMPTYDELLELYHGCTWTWTTQKGVNGLKGTSKTNGNSIFLPAAGCCGNNGHQNLGSYCFLWTSSICSRAGSAYCIDFYSRSYDILLEERYFGLSVRPVCQ